MDLKQNIVIGFILFTFLFNLVMNATKKISHELFKHLFSLSHKAETEIMLYRMH